MAQLSPIATIKEDNYTNNKLRAGVFKLDQDQFSASDLTADQIMKAAEPIAPTEKGGPFLNQFL